LIQRMQRVLDIAFTSCHYAILSTLKQIM
jgi:hypothetical protein